MPVTVTVTRTRTRSRIFLSRQGLTGSLPVPAGYCVNLRLVKLHRHWQALRHKRAQLQVERSHRDGSEVRSSCPGNAYATGKRDKTTTKHTVDTFILMHFITSIYGTVGGTVGTYLRYLLVPWVPTVPRVPWYLRYGRYLVPTVPAVRYSVHLLLACRGG